MIQGTVTGQVWSTRRVEGVPAGAFLEVEIEGRWPWQQHRAEKGA